MTRLMPTARTLVALLACSSVGTASAEPTKEHVAPAARVAQARTPLRVAIVPGIAVNLDAARVDALSQDLAQALNSELLVEASGGLEVRRLLPAEDLPPDCVTDPKCTADVARRTNADQLLFVVMVDSGAGGTIQVDITWVEPSSGRSASRPAIDLTSVTDAKTKFALAARQLLPDAPVRERPTPGGGGPVPTMTKGTPRHFSTTAKITAGVGVVGIGAGIALGLTARSRYRDCENDVVMCSEDDRSSIRTFAAAADVAFVIGIGGAVTTLVLYLNSAEEPRFIVAPTQDGAAVTAVGRF
jgi:hypothetical protein